MILKCELATSAETVLMEEEGKTCVLEIDKLYSRPEMVTD